MRRPAFSQIIAVVAALVVAISTVQLYRVIDCQTELNEQFRIALDQRVQATADLESAQRDLLGAVLASDDSSPAIQQYLINLDELAETRAQNPLPKRVSCP